MIVKSLSSTCAAVYYCARVDIAADRPLSLTDLCRRTGQHPQRVQQHLKLLGALGLVPCEAPRPLLVEEVRAEIDRLILAKTYPSVKELHASLPHRSRVQVTKARALLGDNGINLADLKPRPPTPTALAKATPTPTVLTPQPPRYGPCHSEIVEYRHAWKRIQASFLQTPTQDIHP